MTVRTLGFNVPCRQFVIGAQVTRDKRMPMVDEFALRVLRLCEKVSIARFTAFFGFSQLEMQIVLADLQARSLVVLDGDQVTLHPSAIEMFRTAGTGPPHIVEVEPWINRLWFDLISQSMIASASLRNVRNLIELKQPAGAESLPADFARQAFQSNFRDYLRNVRKINNTDHLSLYAVTSVDPGRFSYAQLTGSQLLRYDPQARVETVLNVPEIERPQRLRQLTDAMTQALRHYTDPEPSLAARTEYGRLIASESLSGATGRHEYVDVREWITSEAGNQSDQSQVFIGCSYLETNRKAFEAMVERSPEMRSISDDATIEIVWLRPGGSLWGTSEDLRSAMSEMRAVIKRGSGCDPTISSTLVMPAALQATQRDQRRRFGNTFDEGVLAPAGLISPAVEILLIRGLGAIVSVVVPLSATARVWVGTMTIRNEDLDRIEKRINIGSKNRGWAKAWTQRTASMSSDSPDVPADAD
jgi:hypothetical protein